MQENEKQKILKQVIFLNISLVVAEISAGVYSGSMALLADALHNLGDVLALVISLVALIYGAKKATDSMTFGYIKAEMMAAFLNALFLVVTMLFILAESLHRLFIPNEINAPIVIAASLIALLVNALSTWLLSQKNLEHHHHHEHNDHHHEDINIKSAYLHMLGDAALSLSVVVGGVVIYLFGIVVIDTLLSLLFSIYIIKETLPLLRKSFFSLMDANEDDIKEIEQLILVSNEVASVHDLHLYRPNSRECYGSAHIVLREDLCLSQIEIILEDIRERLHKAGITHFVLQPESIKYNLKTGCCSMH
ncbi:MAG: cation diffusion facilitator family transporter [Sulfurimonas sp.]|uniref:cation diffusion facilitator family transporter n=1 Tax=Sulfurimonas sp. TaxID=2022749 RepID=UPI00262D56F4|nr:cation diffusion facilitator family transporter [Sulfurimonas sp.]MDD2653289.1 cation diffusion facilitator family transporter [Sulfurimonas sp.]MDD3451244.1 cation diffusion facilitator family transporter [Sulfurimonas sp.]